MIAVEHLDGDAIAGVGVASVLDLGEAPLTQGFTDFVSPDTGPRRRNLHAHPLSTVLELEPEFSADINGGATSVITTRRRK